MAVTGEQLASVVLKRSRHLTDSFYREFGVLYHSYKDQGMTPKEINVKVKKQIDCKDTAYYAYLRVARQKGYITDTHEQTRRESYERARAAGVVRNVEPVITITDVQPQFDYTAPVGVPPLEVVSNTVVSNLGHCPDITVPESTQAPATIDTNATTMGKLAEAYMRGVESDNEPDPASDVPKKKEGFIRSWFNRRRK